jgi:adenosylcobinamide-GDP ribazoletransferase
MWRPFVCALGFLTRFPVPHVELSEAQVARSSAFFPWVGAIIATLLWGVSRACLPLGPQVTSACVITCWALVTGALHLDGLADTFDSLGGGRGDRARMLEIMRDSRIGAHGAAALTLALLLKWVALERVLTLHDDAWLLAPVCARFLVVLLLAGFTYAREQGLGSAFSGRVRTLEVAIAACALLPFGYYFGARVVLPALFGVALAMVLVLRMRKWLGGLTGDVHGAAIEICEIGVLLAACALDLPGA